MATPPRVDEAERGVLGAMLRDNGVIADVLAVLRLEDFYEDRNRKIFEAVAGLFDAGKPVDLVGVAERLHAGHVIPDVGGYGFLGDLWEAAPTGANAVYHASLVREYSLLRQLIHAGNEISRDAADQVAPAEELLESAERRIFSIAQLGMDGQTSSLDAAVVEAYDRIDARQQKGGGGGLPTGYADLDRLTGGLHDGEFTIVAARPSVGKTALGVNIAGNLAIRLQKPVLFVSLEQSRVEIAERLLSAYSNVDSYRFRTGKLGKDDAGRITDAGEQIRPAPLFIDDTPGQGMLRIGANARRHRMKRKVAAVFVDYLQLIEPDNRKDAQHEQLAAISRRLKTLARELQIPVVAMAQLNRDAEDRSRPKLRDLKGSGSLEQDADVVILLHRPQQELAAPIHTIEVLVEKQRNGPVGELTLAYRKALTRFEDYAADPFGDMRP